MELSGLVSRVLLVAMAVVLSVSAGAQEDWWHDDWHYRALATEAAIGPRIEIEANFTTLLAGAGEFAPESVRVVLVRDGQSQLVPSRWEPLPGYDARTAAVVRVTAALPASGPVYVYFDTADAGPFPAGPELEFGSRGNELALDGGFETLGADDTPWSEWADMFSADALARGGKQSAMCVNDTDESINGVMQQIDLNRPRPFDLIFTGFSRCEDVSGKPDQHYSLWADLQYMDGTFLYAQNSPFETGTHDWQSGEVLIHPLRPVKWIKTLGLFRKHSGTARFDDLSLREIESYPVRVAERLTPDGAIVPTNTVPEKLARVDAGDGLSIGIDEATGAVGSVKLDNADWTDALAWPESGLRLRDAAAGSLLLPVGGEVTGTNRGVRQSGELVGLGLGAEVEFIQHEGCIEVAGEVRDLTGDDRCVDVVFGLPVRTEGRRWATALHEDEDATAPGHHATITRTASGELNTYAYCSLADRSDGLSLAVRMDEPALVVTSLECGPAAAMLEIKFSFGLTAAASKHPSRASFRFYIYRHNGEWGMRAAAQRYYDMFPEFFEVRAERQGCWFFGTMDPKEINEPDDFMLVYDEGPHDIAWNHEHGAYSFATTNAQEQWIILGDYDDPNPPVPSYDECVAAMSGWGKEIVENCAAHDENGLIQWTGWHNQQWGGVQGNAHRWMRCTMIDADPEIPGLNSWTKRREWYDKKVERWRGQGFELDGMYIDQVILVGVENYRRDHFAFADRPLAYSQRTLQPVLPIWMTSAEFYQAWFDDQRGLGRLMQANIPSNAHLFFARFFDVIGSEVSLKSERASDSYLRRAMGYRKPISFLMEWHWEKNGIISAEQMETYINRCMFWAVFPGISDAGPKGGYNYWQHPELYERDRETFRRYLPAIHALATAGWQPVTRARCDAEGLWVERYGPADDSRLYFTLRSEGEARAGTLTVDLLALGITGAVTGVQNLMTGETIEVQTDDGKLALPVSVAADRSDAVVISYQQ
jgi:hypothetical protein